MAAQGVEMGNYSGHEAVGKYRETQFMKWLFNIWIGLFGQGRVSEQSKRPGQFSSRKTPLRALYPLSFH